MEFNWAIAIPIFISLVSLYLSWRKAPIERKNLSADGAETFERAASSTATRNIALTDQVNALEKRVDELEDQLEEEMQRSKQFQDWANRLVNQLKSLGETEVPFNPLERKTKPIKPAKEE